MNELKTELYQTSQYHPQTIGKKTKNKKKTQKKIREMVLKLNKSCVKIDLVLFVKKKPRKLIGFVGGL